jgi:hypothetical protein
MSALRKSRQFHIEHLDDRRMMAADISAFVQNGTLFINEAAGNIGAAQAVQVAQLPNGNIRVTGITSPVNPAGSKVNGVSFVEFARPLNIQVNFGGGQDTVQLLGVGGGFTMQKIVIDTAGPAGSSDNDLVNVVNFGSTNFNAVNSLEVRTGAGQDIVRMQNVNSIGFLTIDAGAGADTVDLGPISGGVGGVSVSSDINVFADSFSDTDLAQGGDTVRMMDVSAGRDVIVNLRGGADTLEMTNVLARRHMSLHGEKGNDTMTLTQVTVFESLFALMGDDNDALNLIGVKARNLTADGGNGFDRLVKYNDPGHEFEQLTGWEEINGRLTLLGRVQFPINGTFTQL